MRPEGLTKSGDVARKVAWCADTKRKNPAGLATGGLGISANIYLDKIAFDKFDDNDGDFKANDKLIEKLFSKTSCFDTI